MATITIKYDGRNPVFKNLIEIFKALGGIIADCDEESGSKKTNKAIEELEQGKGRHYSNFEDFKKRMNEI